MSFIFQWLSLVVSSDLAKAVIFFIIKTIFEVQISLITPTKLELSETKKIKIFLIVGHNVKFYFSAIYQAFDNSKKRVISKTYHHLFR